MPTPLQSDSSQEALSRLFQAVTARTNADKALTASYESDLLEAEQQRDRTTEKLLAKFDRDQVTTQGEYNKLRREIEEKLETKCSAIEAERDRIVQQINARAEESLDAAEQKKKENELEVSTMFDAAERRMNAELDALKRQLSDVQHQIATAVSEIQETAVAGIDHLKNRRIWRGFPLVELPPAEKAEQPLQRLTQLVDEAGDHYSEIQGQFIEQSFSGLRPLWIFFVCWAATVLPTVTMLSLPWAAPAWIFISGGAGVVLAAILLGIFYPLASRRSLADHLWFRELLRNAEDLQEQSLKALDAEFRQRSEDCRNKYAETMARRNQESENATAAHGKLVAAANEHRDTEIRTADTKYTKQLDEIGASFESNRSELANTYPARLQKREQQYTQEHQQLHEEYEQQCNEINARRENQWHEMAIGWRQDLADFRNAVSAINGACTDLFPAWKSIADNGRPQTDAVPEAILVGSYQVDLAKVESGIPDDQRLAPLTTTFSMPVTLAFPEHISMMIRSTGLGRIKSEEFMQSVMLRLLVSLPTGRVRFTIIDPIGLGENFSGFMHLADFDERLVASRIWTESHHIERRLSDLTEHMENVFQKYLRNEFRTIQEYNKQAGEVAEPYHFLIVANFPVNFSESAARRLLSIVSSGPRCGVFTLLSVDQKQQIPHNFNLDDIAQHVTTLRATSSQLLCEHPYLDDVEVITEEPPNADQLRTIVRGIGDASKDARRVEVSFQRIAPEEGQIWSMDSRRGVDVPLGRAGATKLQHLTLGSGTSQHVLIAGKTGSGKSTLLHVMITNLAMHYGPDQVEFYLVDFKKGVEFKAYATHRLPHTRVIAIESDREFGLSVLQRLDAVMHERGDLFRKHGVQDVASFRDREPKTPLPRILLLIDEFQEFFVEDDRVAQMSTLLLDRLVRQGRAFGIHVVLGSQTLSGAYTLARSTLGQVAVRIALECSDADAHVILSEENTAARRLARPGEAIYNDANGLLEGNHPFQVAWLSDEQREVCLKEILARADETTAADSSTVIFEGNVPADLAENAALAAVIQSPDGGVPNQPAKAWLGAPVAIKDPVCVEFQRQTGANLLVVGRDVVAATGVLSACLVSLSMQHRATDGRAKPRAQIHILDGATGDAAVAGHWKELSQSLPIDINVIGPRDADDVMAAISQELARRQQEDDILADPIYVFVINLSRFRSFRRTDDEFSFGSDDKPPGADKHFSELLREGPPLGIHAIIWSDNYSNVERWLPRRALHDLEMRVVFQMGSTDSSQLLDSPIAAKLGAHRALLYLEEAGGMEKFRPYNPPSDEWLADIARLLEQPKNSP
ncbi:MAG: FtsK/SpoIIIE domain-containing protein [Pirellulales bacterium]